MRKKPRRRMVIITAMTMPTTTRIIMSTARIAGAATIIRMITLTTTVIITAMPTNAKAKPENTAGALPLLVWLSPAFPVGSFAYSHGIEWAFEAGDVTDAKSTGAWIADLIECGGPWSDAVLLASVHRAASAKEYETLKEVSEFAAALAPSKERKLETMAQGEAFMSAVGAAWPNKSFEKVIATIGKEVAYPVAVGVASASHEIPLRVTLESYLLAVVSNFVSAAVRLIPLGQTDGTKIVASLTPRVREIAARAEKSTLDDVGGAAIRSDIASMKHETQYSRLFRS
jgi:urease accessory protein